MMSLACLAWRKAAGEPLGWAEMHPAEGSAAWVVVTAWIRGWIFVTGGKFASTGLADLPCLQLLQCSRSNSLAIAPLKYIHKMTPQVQLKTHKTINLLQGWLLQPSPSPFHDSERCK